MLKLEELTKDAQAEGLRPDMVVKLVNVEKVGPNARLVAYRNGLGKLDEQTVFRSDEHRLSLATAGRAWAFDADPASFKRAIEAFRVVGGELRDRERGRCKGRAKAQHTITVTNNEIRHGLNQKEKFVLAADVVDGEPVEALYYAPMTFTLEPDWAGASKNLDLARPLKRADSPADHYL